MHLFPWSFLLAFPISVFYWRCQWHQCYRDFPKFTIKQCSRQLHNDQASACHLVHLNPLPTTYLPAGTLHCKPGWQRSVKITYKEVTTNTKYGKPTNELQLKPSQSINQSCNHWLPLTTSLFAKTRNVEWETLQNSNFNTGSLIAHQLQRFV